MDDAAARCRVTVSGPVAAGVLVTVGARFELQSAHRAGDDTELVVGRADQAGVRALLTLLWDTNHVIRLVAVT